MITLKGFTGKDFRNKTPLAQDVTGRTDNMDNTNQKASVRQVRELTQEESVYSRRKPLPATHLVKE